MYTKLKENYGILDGYEPEHQKDKDAFLRHAQAFLKEVGKHMAARGLPGSNISVNQAGIAVSGEVYAKFWNPDQLNFLVSVCIEASPLSRNREDRVIILARKEELKVDKQGKKAVIRSGRLGCNQYPPTDLDSMQLAERLLHIYDDRRNDAPAFQLIESEKPSFEVQKPVVIEEGLKQFQLLEL